MGSSTDRVYRQVHRLYQLGAVAALTDAELLDRYDARRDEAGEAAFEELVIRHGPMVFRVCRGLLHDAHDAEDAFQAVFLVLANRAATIRRKGSVASWLFGVAHRVAARIRRGTARRRALNHLVAGRTPEGRLPVQDDPDWEILHQEILRLPEGLRAAVVLCYLKGLSCAEAARQLGLSAVAVEGRLARARRRLRPRLIRQGVTVPAGLLVAGTAGPVQAAVPAALVHGTIRIALGFLAGDTATSLARGVLNSMFLRQLKLAAVVLVLGLGVSYGAWQASPGPAAAPKAPAPVAARSKTPVSPAAASPYRLTGFVRVEGTGEPVAGAAIEVMISDRTDGSERFRTARSGADGRYALDLPPGSARSWTLIAPVGYWVDRDPWFNRDFAVSRDQPVEHRDYVVRRGRVWDFRITRRGGTKPLPGVVWASDKGHSFRSTADESGRARLTLPTEAGQVRATALETLASENPVPIKLEWQAGFRPDDLATVSDVLGESPRYRLVDRDGRTATFEATGRSRAVPRIVDGKLLVEVTLPNPDSKVYADLIGQVENTAGAPIEGASVALSWVGERGGGMMSVQEGHRAMTDAQGRFRLRSITRGEPSGTPVSISLTVTKDGFAGVDTKAFRFEPAPNEDVQEARTIILSPGCSVTGTVVGPDGKPLVGAWVTPGRTYANGRQFVRTDVDGRFTVRNLPSGMVPITVRYGQLMAETRYLATTNPYSTTVRLRPIIEAAEFQTRSDAAKAVRERMISPAVGTPAPEWDTGPWSDGRARKLADLRGKVVVMAFCGGTSCMPFAEIPSLEKLRARYESLGVTFLVLHAPGDDDLTVRKLLELKQASLVFAADRDRPRDEEFDPNGVTAWRYGVIGYPTIALIDRRGRVAFHSRAGDAGQGMAAIAALAREMGLDLGKQRLTPEDAARVWEAFIGREIDRVLRRP